MGQAPGQGVFDDGDYQIYSRGLAFSAEGVVHKTGHHLQADASAKKYVSIDIGGTEIKYGIMDGTEGSWRRQDAYRGIKGRSIHVEKGSRDCQEFKGQEKSVEFACPRPAWWMWKRVRFSIRPR